MQKHLTEMEETRRKTLVAQHSLNLYKFARIAEIASIIRSGIYSKAKADADPSIKYQDISGQVFSMAAAVIFFHRCQRMLAAAVRR